MICVILVAQCFAKERNYMGDFQKLTHVPKEIPQNVWKIYLNNNCIADIDNGVFAKNSKCTNLRLDWNRLTEVSEGMWTGLLALQFLSLEHNDIKIVHPSAFADLRNLKGLYLDNNKLTALPGNIFPLKQISVLEILTLHNNNLKSDKLDWLHRSCDEGKIQQYTINEDDIMCTSNNSNDKRSAVHNSTQLRQGEPGFLVADLMVFQMFFYSLQNVINV